MKLLMVDNFDSFTYNLVHYLQIAGAEVVVMRNDALDDANISAYDGIVLSPGPGRPEQAGALMAFTGNIIGKKPVLGICLGMQAIGMSLGCELVHAQIPVHGKPREMQHNGEGIFKGLSSPLQVGRYHSLVLDKIPAGSGLIPQAWCSREIMALSHISLPIWGMQFHPESILTPDGQRMINNWISLCET